MFASLPARSDDSKALPWWLGLLVVLAGAGWLATWEPIGRTASHNGRMWMAVVLIGLIAVHAGLLKAAASALRSRARAAWRLVTLLTITFGWFNYYNFDAEWAAGLDDYTDVTYYYLNSKYFHELGYFRLYESMLVANAEGPNNVTPHIRQLRDQDTYEMVARSKVMKEGPDVKSFFTEERWEAFKHDSNWLLDRKLETSNGLKSLQTNFFVDHGYNPPPPWTLIGGTLARLCPVEHVKWITSLDLVLVWFMFAGIWLAFGFDTLLLVMAWWLCTLSGRWPVMTHSLMRFDWVVALGLGVCALRMRRPALGAGLLTWSMCSRVFPFMFGVPVLAWFGWETWRTRRLSSAAKRFVAGGLGTLVVVLGLSWLDSGTDGFVGSAKNLEMHQNDPQAFSSQKVGLADALFYRGEKTRKEMNEASCGAVEELLGLDCKRHGGIMGKAKLIEQVKPKLKVLGVLSLLGVIAWSIRARPPLYQLPALGFLPIYILTTPSYYYFTMRVVLVLWHLDDPRRPRNMVGLLLLLSLEVLTQWMMQQHWERYTTTGAVSVGLGIYFVVVGLMSWWDARRAGCDEVEVTA